jgi:1-acyl-sn-glycerol-3-phosphate acyltransferase
MISEAPVRGWRWTQRFARVVLRVVRWRIVGELPRTRKFVVVVAPHTSNWDFAIGVVAMFALDLDLQWFGKDSLFRWPLAPILRHLGGRPGAARHTRGGRRREARVARASEHFVLALAPEGTRKRVAGWRTGFYRIAEQADLPVVPVRFDWHRREVWIGGPMRPTGDLASDLAALMANYSPEMAFDPAKFWGEPLGTSSR